MRIKIIKIRIALKVMMIRVTILTKTILLVMILKVIILRTTTIKTNKQRKKSFIWFPPPFRKNVGTKIGRYFLNLIYKYFPQDHKFHKVFNRSNMKVSYSCMQNIKSAISFHKIL